jgi:hypothetical protein
MPVLPELPEIELPEIELPIFNTAIEVSPFSFVQFKDGILKMSDIQTMSGKGNVLPVRYVGDISFQIKSAANITHVALIDFDNTIVEKTDDGIVKVVPHSDSIIWETYMITLLFDRPPDCFRILLFSGNFIIAVSTTIFRYTESDDTTQIAYLNEDDSFSFTYCPRSIANRIRLPLLLKEPQFPQKQTIYERRDGRRKLLSASISKEWTIETDYLPEEVHERLIIALAHDEVYMNGKLLTKTNDYTVDYSNILEENGVKCMKGSCKVSANLTHRNGNCGTLCDNEGAVFDVQPRRLNFT